MFFLQSIADWTQIYIENYGETNLHGPSMQFTNNQLLKRKIRLNWPQNFSIYIFKSN